MSSLKTQIAKKVFEAIEHYQFVGLPEVIPRTKQKIRRIEVKPVDDLNCTIKVSFDNGPSRFLNVKVSEVF